MGKCSCVTERGSALKSPFIGLQFPEVCTVNVKKKQPLGRLPRMHLTLLMCLKEVVMVTYYGISLESWTTAANPHQNTLILKISDISPRIVFKDSYFCFQHFLAGPGRGRTFTLSALPLKKKPKQNKSFSEKVFLKRFPLAGTGTLTSMSAFHLIRLQKPPVYSAAVTKKRWEAEPGPKGSLFQFNEKTNSDEVTLQIQLVKWTLEDC